MYRAWQAQRAQTRELPCIAELRDEEEDGNWPPVTTDHDVGLAVAMPMPMPARCSCVVLSWQVAAVRAGELRDLARLQAARRNNDSNNIVSAASLLSSAFAGGRSPGAIPVAPGLTDRPQQRAVRLPRRTRRGILGG